MASLKSAARWVLEEARDGIAWIVLWKEGRGWKAETFYFDYNYRTGVTLDDPDDLEDLRGILSQDPKAIIVNSYIHNLAVVENWVTLDDLVTALRWQYELQKAKLADFVRNIVQTAQ